MKKVSRTSKLYHVNLSVEPSMVMTASKLIKVAMFAILRMVYALAKISASEISLQKIKGNHWGASGLPC